MNYLSKLIVKYAIKVYRASPFSPRLTPRLAKLLAWLNSWRKEESLCVHDLGPFKINIDRSQFIDTQLYYGGVFEPETVKAIRQLVHAGDTVFDVGANIGYMTLVLASCVGEKGKVVAIEPSTWAFDRLVKNVKLNNIRQVACEHAGLGDVTEKNVKLTVPCGYRLDGKNTAVEETVDIFSLDDLVQIRGIQRLDFVKIDTDGMEGAILRGALNTLECFRPKIVFELGPGNLEAHNESPGDLISTLQDLRYSLFKAGTLQPIDDVNAIIGTLHGSETMNIVALPAQLPSLPYSDTSRDNY
jgi:FkbM family methyltransferase